MTLPISVVIPTYNTPTEQLARAINSAMDAGANDIHVVNDGGEPIDYAYPMHLKNGSFVWFYNQPRGGVCAARNFGITSAKSDLIVPLDADDELLPDGLNILYDAWTADSDHTPYTLVYGGWYENDQYIEPPPPVRMNKKNVAHATWLFSRVHWQRVGGYDPDFFFGEDWAFMLALVNDFANPIKVNQPVYRRHIGVNERTNRARKYWPTIVELAREKYPKVYGI